MIARNLFFRDSTPSGPRKHRAYVIGDVHGCLDLLDDLLSRITAEIARRPQSKVSIVFLGDVVDRGPASAQVVERLRTVSIPGASVHFVMGNHEEVMLRVIDGETDLLRSWLRFGGAETLRSYGVDPKELKKLSSGELAARLRKAIPAAHRRFLAGFTDSIAFGDYVLVHAGIRPGIDLSEQSKADLRWIREPFLADMTDHGFVVVHGHTITNEVEIMPNRIGIDTGAFCTGTLTALAIDGKKRWLIQTFRDEDQRVSLGGQVG
jgi:serine/threonine protein phosphatase 1